MNKKAFSKITIIYIALVFIIVWAMFIGPLLSTYGHLAVINGGYTGIEALFYENLNLVVAVVFFISLLGLASMGE